MRRSRSKLLRYNPKERTVIVQIQKCKPVAYIAPDTSSSIPAAGRVAPRNTRKLKNRESLPSWAGKGRMTVQTGVIPILRMGGKPREKISDNGPLVNNRRQTRSSTLLQAAIQQGQYQKSEGEGGPGVGSSIRGPGSIRGKGSSRMPRERREPLVDQQAPSSKRRTRSAGRLHATREQENLGCRRERKEPTAVADISAKPSRRKRQSLLVTCQLGTASEDKESTDETFVEVQASESEHLPHQSKGKGTTEETFIKGLMPTRDLNGGKEEMLQWAHQWLESNTAAEESELSPLASTKDRSSSGDTVSTKSPVTTTKSTRTPGKATPGKAIKSTSKEPKSPITRMPKAEISTDQKKSGRVKIQGDINLSKKGKKRQGYKQLK